MTEKIKVEASTRCYDVMVGDDEVFNIELARFFKKAGPARKSWWSQTLMSVHFGGQPLVNNKHEEVALQALG